jgi:hypothetical protein
MTSKEIEQKILALKRPDIDAKYLIEAELDDLVALIQQAIGDYVEPHIKYCEEKNGLSYCKNCQLTRLEENTNE